MRCASPSRERRLTGGSGDRCAVVCHLTEASRTFYALVHSARTPHIPDCGAPQLAGSGSSPRKMSDSEEAEEAEVFQCSARKGQSQDEVLPVGYC